MTADLTADRPEPLAVYLHWPFCRSKCPYCDVNSHVRTAIDQTAWRAALLAELDHAAAETRGRTVSSVFFGGGTPSLMAPATVAALIDRIAGHWRLADDLEVTLEANPTSAEAASFQAVAAAGVNRLSLGVQALDDAALAALGRTHSAAEARAAVALAARTVARWSIDLIYARPGQTVAAWQAELADALDQLVGEHLSVYQLTPEPGTALHRDWTAGTVTLTDPDLAADLFEATQAHLASAGLPAYEISNHARPGGACRHNLTYWQSGDWLGIGPGAHGRLTRDGTRRAIRRHRAPEIWRAQVATAGHGTAEDAPLTPRAHIEEILMMGLRLTEGLGRTRLTALTGRDAPELIAPAALDRLGRAGLLALTADRLRATARGRACLNTLLASLEVREDGSGTR